MLRLHRRIGIIAALFVVLLSISGLALQHSATLGLDTAAAGKGWLLRYYGIEQPELSASYAAGDEVLSGIGDALYFSTQRVPGIFAPLRGVVPASFGYVAATTNQLVLLTETGELVEILSNVHGVPRNLRRIGSASDAVILEALESIYEINLDTVAIEVLERDESVRWSQAVAAPPAMAGSLQQDYAASLVSWERIVLDLHSGRILGPAGALLVDVMALLFLFMALTGIYLWNKKRSFWK